jgi:DNA-binding IclR family transcriptional regulator
MRILGALADRPMRLSELSAALGLNRTTGHRALTYLREAGYVQRDESGMFFIGPRLYYIGSAYVDRLPVVQAARPYLKAAVEETDATAQLVERHGSRSLVLMVFEPRTEFIPKATIGYHFPLHCGAKGLVLLAHADQEFIDAYLQEPLEAFTRYTITHPSRLAEQLEKIRQDDYAIGERDVQLTSSAVAAPIRNARGNVIASVTLIAGAPGFSEKRDHLLDMTIDAARSISRVIGWHPETARSEASRSARQDQGPAAIT